MNSRKLAGASAASVGAVTAVAALLLGTLSGTADEDKRKSASAFGIAVDGLLDIDPTPYVEAPPDESKALLELPGPNKDGIYIGVLKVEAEHFRSKATALKVNVLGLKLKVLEAKCENGRGDATIISTDGDGGSSPYEGEELDLSPVIRVEFNRQHRDGDKLTVDAAVVSLLPGDKTSLAIGQQDLDLLKSVAPKDMKVPANLQEVKSEEPKAGASASTKPGSSASPQPGAPVAPQPGAPVAPQPGASPKPGAPAAPESGAPKSDAPKSSQPSGPVTVGDLMKKLTQLNPNLAAPKGDDALLEIVISSASCKEERRKEDRKEEAPAPKPVEADLPVTH
ncbi:MAG: hypothetical protein ACRDRG_12780 [Pseudonocardiaceae bacterium]